MLAFNPIMITNSETARFLMNSDEAVELVRFALNRASLGDFLVPKVDSSTLGVLDLAKDMRLFSVLSCANYLAQDRAERNAI